MCACVGQRSALDVIPQELSIISFRAGSWLGPQTCQLSQVGLWTPREQPPPLQHWPCRHRPAHCVFYVGTGNQTREASTLSTELFLLCPCQGGFKCFLRPGSNATYLDFSLASLRWLLCSFTFALAAVEMLKAKVTDRKDNRFRGRRLKWKFPPHISIGSWQHTQCPLQERGELSPNSVSVMSWSYMSGHGLQPFPWLLAQIGSPSLLVNTAPLPVRIGVGSIASLSPHAYHWPYPLTVSQKRNVIFSS